MSKQDGFESISIDNVQNYWNRRPCNIRHSQQPVGSREYYEEVETRKYFVEPHIPEFAEFGRWKGKKVLEIGCGIGTDTMNFARHGAEVTSVDLSEKSIEIAKKRAKVFGLDDRITFYRANAEELSSVVPIQTYDLIYSFGVIHHTPHPGRVLDQLNKYAGPETELKVMVYHRRSWKVLWILLKHGLGRFWQANKWVAKYSEAQTGCPITYSYSRSEGRDWIESHRFKVTDVSVDHIFPYRFPDYNNYQYKKVWYFRIIPKPIFRWMEKQWGWHLCLTANAIGEVETESHFDNAGNAAKAA